MAYLGVKPAAITSATQAEIAGDLTVDTNTLKVDSSNNRVGIGDATPDDTLTIYGGTAKLRVGSTDSNHVRIGRNTSTGHFEMMRTTTGATDQVFFKAVEADGGAVILQEGGGNVGIGNSSPSHLLDATVSSDSATARFGTTDNSGNNHGTVIISNGGSGDAMLRFDYEGSNTDRARIGLTASGQQLEFYTAGNNERMRITSGGLICVGRTSGGGRVNIQAHTNNFMTEFYNQSGSSVGSITTNGSSTSYNTSSDHRLKENVADMTGAIDRVKALAPKRFQFIADADTTVDGFLAHEAQAVVPEAVTGTHNEVDDDGNAVMQGIDQSKLVPLLTAALKESIAKIETLETEMTALKARVTALEDA